MIKTREQIEQEFENINRPLELDIQKGRAAVVGEIREWSGKKYKKQGNGKWIEVSGEGKSKRQHLQEFHNNLSRDRHGEFSTYTKEDKERIINEQKDQADKLSDKEYDDTDFEEKEEKQTYKKGDKIEFNGVTIHVGKDTSGGQDTLTYKAPDVSDKTFWDLDKLKEKISGVYSPENKKAGELKTLLGKEDATITIKKKDGDDIIYVNGQTAYNSSDKGMISNEDKKKALTRAYEASKNNKVEKSLEDHFNNINSKLSFEKSEDNDLEKGDMQYALGDIKFKKKGSELKKMIEAKKSKLIEVKTEIKTKLDNLVNEYIENGGSIVYDENNIPNIKELKDPCCESVSDYSNIQSKKVQVPNGFWDGQWKLRSVFEDIKTLETLQSNLEDNKEYEMTTRQLTCLR